MKGKIIKRKKPTETFKDFSSASEKVPRSSSSDFIKYSDFLGLADVSNRSTKSLNCLKLKIYIERETFK